MVTSRQKARRPVETSGAGPKGRGTFSDRHAPVYPNSITFRDQTQPRPMGEVVARMVTLAWRKGNVRVHNALAELAARWQAAGR